MVKMNELEKVEHDCMANLRKTIIENKQKYESFKDHLNSSLDGKAKVSKGTTNVVNYNSNKKSVASKVKINRVASAVTNKKPGIKI